MRTSILGRLRYLQYIFTVIYETLRRKVKMFFPIQARQISFFANGQWPELRLNIVGTTPPPHHCWKITIKMHYFEVVESLDRWGYSSEIVWAPSVKWQYNAADKYRESHINAMFRIRPSILIRIYCKVCSNFHQLCEIKNMCMLSMLTFDAFSVCQSLGQLVTGIALCIFLLISDSFFKYRIFVLLFKTYFKF